MKAAVAKTATMTNSTAMTIPATAPPDSPPPSPSPPPESASTVTESKPASLYLSAPFCLEIWTVQKQMTMPYTYNNNSHFIPSNTAAEILFAPPLYHQD